MFAEYIKYAFEKAFRYSCSEEVRRKHGRNMNGTMGFLWEKEVPEKQRSENHFFTHFLCQHIEMGKLNISGSRIIKKAVSVKSAINAYICIRLNN